MILTSRTICPACHPKDDPRKYWEGFLDADFQFCSEHQKENEEMLDSILYDLEVIADEPWN